jgi:HAD superfamily hydrolase (TIGR01450 family)
VAQLHDVALLDLDGVVYVGPEAVPYAAEALAEARSRFGMRSVFVTNNAARPPSQVAQHLVELGVPAQPGDVVTSAQAGARMLADLLAPGARVLAIGGPGVAEALAERGLVPVLSADDEPVALMQGYGPQVGWAQLAEGSLAIARDLPWVATNTDRTIPTARGRVLGNGALVAALRHASGVEPMVAGKPQPPLMKESVQRAGAVRPLVVGDRLDTDIEGAQRSQIPSMLVLTGVTDWQDALSAPPEQRPTFIGRDLRDLMRPPPRAQAQAGGDQVESRCGEARVRVQLTGDAAEPGTGERAATDAGWWLPEHWREAGRAGAPLTDADLDMVHALVAAAWFAADRQARIAEPAETRTGTAD